MLYPAHVYHPCDVSWLWVWWSGSRNTPSFHATETGMSIGLIDHLACIMQTLLYFTSCELYFIMYVLFLVVSCRWAKKQRLMFGMQAPWELCLCLKVFTGGASSVLTSQVHCIKDVKADGIHLSYMFCYCSTNHSHENEKRTSEIPLHLDEKVVNFQNSIHFVLLLITVMDLVWLVRQSCGDVHPNSSLLESSSWALSGLATMAFLDLNLLDLKLHRRFTVPLCLMTHSQTYSPHLPRLQGRVMTVPVISWSTLQMTRKFLFSDHVIIVLLQVMEKS